MKKPHIASAIFILFGVANHASAESAIESLSKCDASFFTTIKKDAKLKGILSKLDMSKAKTDGRLNIPADYVSPEGIKVSNFVVIYTDFDKYKDTGVNDVKGQFYYWGFESPQSLVEVSSAISKKIPLVRAGDLYTYNSMIRKGTEGKWMHDESGVSGVAPEENTAEKVFFVEESKERGVVSLVCSLQGRVIDNDLILTGLDKK